MTVSIPDLDVATANFVLDAGGQTIAGDKILSGNNSYSGTSTFSNTITASGAVTISNTILGTGTSADFKRIYSSTASGATALATTDFGTLTNWGTGAVVKAVTGTDQRFKLTITSGTTAATGALVTLNFKDPDWTAAPVAVACLENNTAGASLGALATATTASTLIIKTLFDPTDSVDYIINCIVMG